MVGLRARPLTFCKLAVIGLLASMPRAQSSPYYAVTDLGPYASVQQTTDSHGQGVVTNLVTGTTKPFPTGTFIPLTPQEQQSLPGVSGILGATYPQFTTFPIRVYSKDSRGTLLGVVPSGDSRAIPYSTVLPAYTVEGPDGKFSGVTVLSSDRYATALLGANDEILVRDTSGIRLLNPSTGVTTDLRTLLQPQLIFMDLALRPVCPRLSPAPVHVGDSIVG